MSGFQVNGRTLGIVCARTRRLVDIGPALTNIASVGIEIHRGKYDTPFGQVVGLRNGSLLCERCFSWIGDHWWKDNNTLCFLVRRLSEEGVRQIWVASINIQHPDQYCLTTVQEYGTEGKIDPSILIIIREATNRLTAHSSCD